jgi:pimeloyl-ACP methyl ester carboxylesterase
MPYADLGDVTLFYTDDGIGGPPLLLVHGYSCDSHDWLFQLPAFTQTNRVIAVDLRGHGRSSAPAAGYSASDLAGDLARLLERLDTGPVVAVGHSLGGVVVSALAVEHPDLVSALVCVDPAYLLPDETEQFTEPLLAALDGDDAAPFAQQLLMGFDSPARTPEMRTWQVRRAAGVAPHVLRQAFESQVSGLALRSHSEPFLARRRCPVLSFYADPERVAIERVLFADERSRAIGWEGAGHWLHQERPAEFNALVAAWVNEKS